ncbi:MAG: hypothetical protein FJ398_02780 [Verrucomicrobia bacterium]|nr:hypothetical protein [Verrucomicrobiota bacterium]
MNSKQKTVRIIGMLVVVLAALFPPWRLIVDEGGAQQVSSLGFHPLWNPPTPEVAVESEQTAANSRINLLQLGVELGILLVVVNGAVYLLKDKEQALAED